MNFTYSIVYMFLISTIIGYWTMSVLVYKTSDLTWNLNKFYSAILMGWTMAIAELFMHSSMIDSKSFLIILFVLLIGSAFTIYLIREQVQIDELQFLRSMIEHHSMAITMSEKLIKKPDISKDTIKLANNIIQTQNKEIDQMKKLLSSAKS